MTQPGKRWSVRADQKGNVRIGALLAVLAAVVLVGWLVLRDGDDDQASGGPAEIATVEELRENAASKGTPVYWAGPPQDGAELELSKPDETRTYVRYLTGGAKSGDPREFLTVGTYEFVDPIPALETLSEGEGGVQRTAPGGGIVYFNRDRPESVYLAYPGIDVQIEVFDPDPVRAKNLVTSGQIVPVN